MKKRLICTLALGTISLSSSYAFNGLALENDTIKNYTMDEIIVTSSAKETNALKALPGAVSLLTPQQIASRQIEALKDISSFVPNLYMPDYGAKLTSAIYIRGIGARSSGQSVGLYVDNAPYLDKSSFDFELTDIQRIEILRGPQGTLYGRNAMGGIINIYTLSPFDFQGKKLTVSAGSYGQYKIKASHYAKLSSKIGFTAAAYYEHDNGFFTNTFTGKKLDKSDNVGGRFKIEGRFNPHFQVSYSFSGDYVNEGGFPYGKFIGSGNIDHRQVEPICINDSSTYRRTLIAQNLSLSYHTDRLLFTSTTGYQYLNDDMNMDQDFSPKSIFTLNQKQKQHAISQEFSLRNQSNGNYNWSFGLHGFYNDLRTEGPVTFKEEGIQEVLQPVFDQLKASYPKMPYLKILDQQLLIPGTFDTPSYGIALFHQSTYNNLFIPGLSLTAGIRLDYEKQKMHYQSEAKMNMGIGFKAEGPFTPIDKMMPKPISSSVIDEHIAQDFWQVLPKVSLKYACSPSTFTYLSVSKGYKAGGYNVQMSADVMQSQMKYDMMSSFQAMMPTIKLTEPTSIEQASAYKPEKSWNYEIGVRSELQEGKLTAELTGFYMDIQDLQLTQFVNSGSGRILTNVGKAKSYGIEGSLRWRITPELTADANYGFTKASFRNYNNGKQDFVGNAIPYTPRHTLNIGLHYTRLLHSCWIDQVTASAQFGGAGKIYWTEANDTYQRFYGTLNAKAGVRKGAVSLNLWSRNLTNTRYAAFYFESFGNPFIQLGKPFQIGAEVSLAF